MGAGPTARPWPCWPPRRGSSPCWSSRNAAGRTPCATLGGSLADRWGTLRILRVGTGLVLLGLVSLLLTTPRDHTLSLTVRLMVIGLGFGLFQAPNLNEILREGPPPPLG